MELGENPFSEKGEKEKIDWEGGVKQSLHSRPEKKIITLVFDFQEEKNNPAGGGWKPPKNFRGS